ncbi:MAG: UDP-N-acetylmuramate--L-alanine ligase [Gemmatimonadota bacterium]
MNILDTQRPFHFLGIGGAGMSALAEVLLHRGYDVSGCDLRHSAATAQLESLGVRVAEGHDAEHLDPAAAVVVSAAIPPDNRELVTARERGQTIVHRADLLAAVMAGARGIAVAGTHGKSTTTTMVGAVLEAAGWDPTVIVGGQIRGQAGNVRLGAPRGDGGGWIVAEADEFNRSFLALAPDHAVITNIEADHLDTYGSLEAVREAFAAFAAAVPPGGTLALGIDDAGVRALAVPPGRARVTFGFDTAADVRATDVRSRRRETDFALILAGEAAGETQLALPGRHNVLNALGAAAIAYALQIGPAEIRAGLAAVQGVGRRFDLVHRDEGVLIVDDYAHHPTEIAATLAAARAGWPERRLVAVFQPHLYSRTRDFADAFGSALATADRVIVTDVYPAREQPLPGVTGELVVAAARRAGARDVTYWPELAAEGAPAIRKLDAGLEPGDLVVTLGAGDVDGVAKRLAAWRGSRSDTMGGRSSDARDGD